MQELKIFIYEENGKLFSQIGDSPIEFKLPHPFWEGYNKKKQIEDTKLIPFGKLIFDNIFCNDERVKKFEDIYNNLKVNEKFIIQIISTSTLAHSIPFEIMAYKTSREHILLKRQNIYIVRKDSDSNHKVTPSKSIFKILFIISLPLDTYKKSPIDPLKEYTKIFDSLGDDRNYVQIDILESSSYVNIRREITKNSYDIIHFSGHGLEGGLVIEEDGNYEKERVLENSEINELFKGIDTKVVILDACLTSASSSDDRFFGTSVLKQFENIPLVFGNQASISDSFATKEMEYIYSNIFKVKPYQLLRDVRSDNSSEWWKSTIFIDGDINTPLFEIGEKKLENRVFMSLGYFNPNGKFIYRYEAVRKVLEELREKSFAILHGIGGAGKSYLADYIMEFLKGRYKYIIGIDLKSYKDKNRDDIEIIRDITKEFYKAKVISKEKYKELKDEDDFEIGWEELKECFDSEVFLVIDNIDLWLKNGVIEAKERENFIKDITSIEFNGKVLFTSRENFSLDKRGRKNFKDNLIEIETYSDNEFKMLLKEYYESQNLENKKVFKFLNENIEFFREYDFHPLFISKAINMKTLNIDVLLADKYLQNIMNFYERYFIIPNNFLYKFNIFSKFNKKASTLIKIFLLNSNISREFYDILNENGELNKINSKIRILKSSENGETFKIYKLIADYGLSILPKKIIYKEEKKLFKIFKELELDDIDDITNAIKIFEKFEYRNEKVGIYYRMLGDYLNKKNFYIKAIKILKNEPLELSITYHNFAIFLQKIAHFEESEYYYFEALKIQEEKLGKKHTSTATIYNHLGSFFCVIGEFETSKYYCFEALKIREEILGENHLDVGASYNNIGELFYRMEKFKDAEYYHFKALKIRKEVLGEIHLDVANSYNNIGELFRSMNMFNEAKIYLLKSLEITKNLLGISNFYISVICNNLGGVFQAQGEFQEAEIYFSKALEIREEILGKNHPSTATTYNNLGLILRDLNKFEEAKIYFLKALEIREKILGKNHSSTVKTYNNLILVLRDLAKFKEAQEIVKDNNLDEIDFLNLKDDNLIYKNLVQIHTYSNLALLYKDKGDFVKAKKYFIKILEIRKKVLGENHIDVSITHNNLGSIFQNMQEFEEAKIHFLKALEIKEKALGQYNPSIAITYDNLALLFGEIKDFENAKKHYFKAYKSLENTEHYFEAFIYFIEYLKVKNKINEDISQEVCEAIQMLDNIVNFYQRKDLTNQALFAIEPIFKKADLSNSRCREKYEKYQKYIFAMSAMINQQNNNENLNL